MCESKFFNFENDTFLLNMTYVCQKSLIFVNKYVFFVKSNVFLQNLLHPVAPLRQSHAPGILSTLHDRQHFDMKLSGVCCEMRHIYMNYEIRGAKNTRNVIWSRTVVASCRDLCPEVHSCKKCWFGKLGAKCDNYFDHYRCGNRAKIENVQMLTVAESN